MHINSSNQVDVSKTLDEGGFSGYQMLLVVGAALTIILDGIDNLLLGPAIPTLIEEWGVPRSAFSTALAASPLGMMIGGGLGGWLGDRFGRRTALLGSVLSFAAITAAISLVNDVTGLAALRFLAGFGLGGAMPNATALASEYVPRRNRPFAVTLTIVCIPFGGMLAAFLAATVIPTYGWRTFFVIGGAIPFAIGVVLLKVLPESPRYLANRPQRWPELASLLRKFGHDVPMDVEFIDQSFQRADGKSSSIADLFGAEFLKDTLALIVSFFFCLMVNYVGLLLLPSALTSVGYASDSASRALGWWTMGGVLGALGGAMYVQRVGSKQAMLGLSAVSIVSAAAVALMPLGPENLLTLAVLCIVLGTSLNAVQVAMYALAAHVYPTEIRGRGIGTVVAVARVGNVVAPFVGNYALDHGGAPAYFATFSVGMIVVFLALAVIGRHIEPSGS